MSHLARGVWIEIFRRVVLFHSPKVTPRKRCVDWNRYVDRIFCDHEVTPRKRCVDWNNIPFTSETLTTVTPRKRCVDWNVSPAAWGSYRKRHTSQEVCGLKCARKPRRRGYSRHTSQEVCGLKYDAPKARPAAPASHLARGVWIEMSKKANLPPRNTSHLARGVWIEIYCQFSKNIPCAVTPRKRCVDWNCCNLICQVRFDVTPRKRCVDWNYVDKPNIEEGDCHTSQEVCGLKSQALRIDIFP